MAPRKNPLKIFNEYPIPSAIGIIVLFVIGGYYIFQIKNAPPADYMLAPDYACYPSSTLLNLSAEVVNKQKPIPNFTVYEIKNDKIYASFNNTKVGNLGRFICIDEKTKNEYPSYYVIGKKY